MRTKAVLACAAICGTLSVSAARATVYDYTFTTDDGGPVTSIVGTFTTLSPADIFGVAITGMTGTLFGIGDTIVGVIVNPSSPVTITSPDGAFNYDDLLYSSQPYLDYSGVLFTTTNNVGGSWNLFSNGGDPYDLYAYNPDSGITVIETGTLSVSAVPEVSTWAMILLGFAGLGFAGHRTSRKRVQLTV